MKFGLKYQQSKGTLEFDGPGDYALFMNDPVGRDLIDRFLTTPRQFRIPESQQLDDFRVDRVKPVEDENYLYMALCEIFSEIGVEVQWPQQPEE